MGREPTGARVWRTAAFRFGSPESCRAGFGQSLPPGFPMPMALPGGEPPQASPLHKAGGKACRSRANTLATDQNLCDNELVI